MVQAYIGTIMLWAGKFAPRGWMYCHGQMLCVSDYSILFSVISTTYGGNGRSNFQLPDLRNKAVIGNGTGIGLKGKKLGENIGNEIGIHYYKNHYHMLDNVSMDLESLSENVPIKSHEVTIDSTGLYGVPISNSLKNPSSSPSDSEYYLGKSKLPVVDVYTYMNSTSEPKITTKPTIIDTEVKVIPKVKASLSGDVMINELPYFEVEYNEDAHAGESSFLTYQPSMVLDYIICTEGSYPPRT